MVIFVSLVAVSCSVEVNIDDYSLLFNTFSNLFCCLFLTAWSTLTIRVNKRGNQMEQELIKMHLTVSPVVKARVSDAATREGYATSTQWIRNAIMAALETSERKAAERKPK